MLAIALMFAVLGLLSLASKKHEVTQVAQGAAKPNVIQILADDLDVETFQAMLDAGYLPNIKARLVNQGTTFDNSFVSDALCCPSRATNASGQYPHNTKVTNNGPAGGILSFDDKTSLATWLHTSGYFTGFLGKYLNSYGYDPTAATGNQTNPYYVPPGWDVWDASIDYGGSTYTANQYILNANGQLGDFKPYGNVSWNYWTDMQSLLAGNQFPASFLSQWHNSHSTQPFYLWVNPVAPHFYLTNRATTSDTQVIENVCPAPADGSKYPGLRAPMSNPGSLFGIAPVAPARYQGTLTGKLNVPQPPNFNALQQNPPSWLANRPALTASDLSCLQATYTRRMEAMRAVDDQVGYLFSILDSYGAANNTMVIFTSDNGYSLGQHRLIEKTWPYEEDIRVPLVIHMPGQTTAKHSSVPVLNNDIAATVAAVAGATPTHVVDGANLSGYLTATPATTGRQMLFIEQYLGVVDGTQASVLNDLPQLSGVYIAARVFTPTPEMYVVYQNGEQEFYNLATDPYELNNTASDPANAAEITRLKGLITKFSTCTGMTCKSLEFNGQ